MTFITHIQTRIQHAITRMSLPYRIKTKLPAIFRPVMNSDMNERNSFLCPVVFRFPFIILFVPEIKKSIKPRSKIIIIRR